jgi:arylsulfatase A-like enzyme
LDVRDKPAYIQGIRQLSSTKIAAIDAFRQHQYEALQAVDDGVGTIVQALADTGRLDNTIIIYASDNGYLWGEHRWTAKLVPYEESIRVPFVVRWDRLSGEPRADARLVANIDVAPTLAEFAGTTAPGADGRSLAPLLTGSPFSWRTTFLIEHYGDPGAKPPTYCAVRSQTQLFVRYGTGEEEFYTLPKDPFELKNKSLNAGAQAGLTKLRDKARALCNPLPPGMPGF